VRESNYRDEQKKMRLPTLFPCRNSTFKHIVLLTSLMQSQLKFYVEEWQWP
jgi:hypothetical protein